MEEGSLVIQQDVLELGNELELGKVRALEASLDSLKPQQRSTNCTTMDAGPFPAPRLMHLGWMHLLLHRGRDAEGPRLPVVGYAGYLGY